MVSPEPVEKTPKPRGRTPLLLAGGALALAAGLGAAWVLTRHGDGTLPPPASTGGLVIEAGNREGEGRLEAGKPLRCFVQGRFVGELALSDCARRNGVATDALDVGVDPDGALAAAEPADEPSPADAPQLDQAEAAPRDPVSPDAATAWGEGLCWRHGAGRWRRLGEMDQNACVQALFAGTCERPGMASYGRYGQQTLRRVAGRIEVSEDNRNFRPLAVQAPDCSIPPAG